ncbi:hypothetical protein [Maribacter sp. 2210JD10-5]|uniref:hypothetical protein n=1 Tax=Maribacter sp. 2210JD10-5 TaxID=3386272 RepID=UPI0039BD6089
MKRVLLILGFLTLTFSACKKKSAPKPPEAVQLIFPERNSECTVGDNLSATATQIEFRWQAADNTETYDLRVTNINTGVVQTLSNLSTTSGRLPIQRGEPFTWRVTSKNGKVQETVSSVEWSFYNQGSTTTFAPFPAEAVFPEMASKVFKDVNNEVELSWTASDLDNDISEYEVYFSTETSPDTLIDTLPLNTTVVKVNVAADTVYYWRVVVKDAEGNATNSNIYSFKVS